MDEGSVGLGRRALESADSGAALVHGSLDSEVSLFSPGNTPGVLQKPVVLALVSSISNHEYGVIQVGTAPGAVDNSGCVALEDLLVGFDGNGDGSLGTSSLQSSGAVLGHKIFSRVLEL